MYIRVIEKYRIKINTEQNANKFYEIKTEYLPVCRSILVRFFRHPRCLAEPPSMCSNRMQRLMPKHAELQLKGVSEGVGERGTVGMGM